MTRAENGLALGALVVVTAGSLGSDAFGQIGTWISAGLRGAVGVAAWLVPLWLADTARRTFVGHYWAPMRAVRWLLLLLLSALSLTLIAGVPGGRIGQHGAELLTTSIGLGAHMFVVGTWVVILLRLLGHDRVESIATRASVVSHQAITNVRPRLARASGPMFAPVIDTVGVPVGLPPVPVPVPAPPVPAAAPQPPAAAQAPRPIVRKPSSWALPDISLLQEPSESSVDAAYRLAVAKNLGERLRHFNINATVAVSQQQGAVVSRYEITPGASQGLKPIVARAADLEAAYKGLRFADLHGTGKLGVEIPVPDAQRSTIALRMVLDSAAWTDSDAALPLALGVTSSGEPVVIDLAACPHLLAAGATGSGKSVGINCMLISLLLRNSPDQLQLVLIDPKMVEFARYRQLPHLVCPVITENAEAVERLRWAVEEMEARYRRFVDADVEKYDEFIEATNEKLPRIVIVIDEYADLVSIAKNDVEQTVVRLAQKARAAGIHLILATQRPSVDVITGVIKANFPARIAYKVSQRQDSQTIVGGPGAEKLLGLGDSLCLIPQLSIDLTRVHGAFVDKDEARAVCRSWSQQTSGERKPEPPKTEPDVVRQLPPIREQVAAAKEFSRGVDVAQDYVRAIDLARTKGHASARLFVDELGIGFSKAKKLFARMHDEGLVKPGGPNNTHLFCGESQ